MDNKNNKNGGTTLMPTLFEWRVARIAIVQKLLFTILCSVPAASLAEDSEVLIEDVTENAPFSSGGDGASSDLVMEEVFVTGSLLPRGNFASNAPITTIGSEQFEISNAVNIESLLNTLPQILAGSDRTSTFGLGWATADLRGLGENRTLTLLDGKRVVPTFADGGTVDLNFIPPGIVDRVEVLTGGASTTYGSDAMAGVINLITKSNQQGFELVAAAEMTGQGDAEILNLAGTWGTAFDNDRGHFMVHIDATERRSLNYHERTFSTTFKTEFFDQGISQGFRDFRFPSAKSGALQFFGFGEDVMFTPEGGDVVPFDQFVDGYDPTENLELQIPQDRLALFSKTNWQGESFEIRFQAHIANSKLDRMAPTVSAGPWIGPQRLTIQDNPFLSNSTVQTLSNTPFVQFNGSDSDGNGIPENARAVIGRTFSELGPSRWDQTYSLRQFEIGFTRDLTGTWNLDGYVNHGEIEMDWTATPAIIQSRFAQSLLLDVSDTTGQTCLDPTDGCVPANIYGLNSISPAALDFISTDVLVTNESKITTANLLLSGNTAGFFEMPGGVGPVGVAVGLEYISRSQEIVTDDRAQSGELFYWGFFPVSADVTTSRRSAFFELLVPLAEGLPLLSFAELELAGRYTDHETIGGVTSFKTALSWYPVEDVQVRGSFNKAVRAPSINDLYIDFGDRAVVNAPQFSDPCSAIGFANANPDYLAELCVLTGVPLDQVGSESLNVGPDGVPVYFGGNASLEEETGNTISVGIVWTPYSIDGLSASVDYFDIEIEDYIGQLPGGFGHVENCFFPSEDRGTYNAYCNSVERNDQGVLTQINAGRRNLATHSISGFDFSINKTSDFLGGFLDATYVASIVNSKKYSVNGSTLESECAGRFNSTLGGQACARPVTELKHRATLFWTRDVLSLQLTWRHLSGVDDGDEDVQYLVERIPSFDYFELGATYDFSSGITLIGGIRNLLDEDPPVLGDNSFEANTYPNLYDVFGRTFYGRATYKF